MKRHACGSPRFPHGASTDEEKLSNEVLPNWFPTSKYSSFVRQLIVFMLHLVFSTVFIMYSSMYEPSRNL